MSNLTKYEAICTVDREWNTIQPTFVIDGQYTSGELKYFSKLAGRKVKVTIEVLEDEPETTSTNT